MANPNIERCQSTSLFEHKSLSRSWCKLLSAAQWLRSQLDRLATDCNVLTNSSHVFWSDFKTSGCGILFCLL
jgi:hypothetical protein